MIPGIRHRAEGIRSLLLLLVVLLLLYQPYHDSGHVQQYNIPAKTCGFFKIVAQERNYLYTF